MQYITPDDLAPFATIDEAKALAMIEDAESMAVSVAPCLTGIAPTLTDDQRGTVKAILRRAVLRWNEIGTGAVSQQSAGPFGQSLDTTRSAPKSLFWPSEIGELQAVCRDSNSTPRAFSIDTTPARGTFGVDYTWISTTQTGPLP